MLLIILFSDEMVGQIKAVMSIWVKYIYNATLVNCHSPKKPT